MSCSAAQQSELKIVVQVFEFRSGHGASISNTLGPGQLVILPDACDAVCKTEILPVEHQAICSRRPWCHDMTVCGNLLPERSREARGYASRTGCTLKRVAACFLQFAIGSQRA
eukprot:gb/GFBE01033909.1/.p1 GENE.gb/GFBE01033909.1/~~gb/GFBE01033909.1/.p1  ORF type:complete len:113 (+),score=12.06 gb/GFBE01033909.1/:1-339(+)